jgi:ParB family chromosome partitioning protein
MGKWVIIAGERRYRAALAAGLKTIVCVEAKGDQAPDEVLEDQLVENCLREDLRPLDQAHAFKRLLDHRGWTHRQLAAALHIAPGSVAKALALLDAPAPVRELVEADRLAPSVAYEVSKLPDPAAATELAGRAAAEGMTRDQVADEVRRRRDPKAARGRGARPKPHQGPWSCRTAAGRVMVEPKRGAGPGAILEALEAATAKYRAEVAAQGAAA